MAITTALDVARRARGIVAVGRTIDSPTQRVEWAYRWDHRCMPWRSQRRWMWRIVLAGSWPWGERLIAQLNVSSGRIDGVIDACVWRSQRRWMWRVVLAGSWTWGARLTAHLDVSSGRIDEIIGACYGDHNGARCGALCSQDRGRGAHGRQPNSTCRVGASMGSSMHADGDHNGARCRALCWRDRGRGAHD